MARYKVTIGDDFAIDGTDIQSVAAVERLAAMEERRRNTTQQKLLAGGVFFVTVAAVAIAAAVGWLDGTYDELKAVWGVGGVWVGWVLGHYFRKN